MYKTICITPFQRALILNNETLIRILTPGKHRIWMKKGDHCHIFELANPFTETEETLKYWFKHPDFKEEVTALDVSEREVVLHYVNGICEGLYRKGFYLFWNHDKVHTFKRFSLDEPFIETHLSDLMPFAMLYPDLFLLETVPVYAKGIYTLDEQIVRVLEPGRYLFWRKCHDVDVHLMDMRIKTLEVHNQEILTSDKVPLRLNFVCQYAITDAVNALKNYKKHEDQLYVALQLVLREVLGAFTFDDIMAKKQAIHDTLLEKCQPLNDSFYIQIHSTGIKDIILPGDIRDIMNTVLLAEKKAAANIIARREETASTRSLLNTAKLMDDNKTLYRLKELEYLERICEHIDTISLNGRENLLKQLESVF